MPRKKSVQQHVRSWNQLNEGIISCRKCPRLIDHCQSVATIKRKAFQNWEYWGKPVPNFGDEKAKILVVGLAPGAHGANRTGRMFTGDRSGDFLFEAMHAVGLCNQPESDSIKDGLQLKNCAITAVCHCAPPANKPTTIEQENCWDWLVKTISPREYSVFVALGQLAWKAMIKFAFQEGWIDRRNEKFGHHVELPIGDGKWLLGCYHPSQQNTFTGRLTQPMLRQVLLTAIQKSKNS